MQSFVTDTDMNFKHKRDQCIYEQPDKYMLPFMHTETKENSHKSPGKCKGESQTELILSRYTVDVVNLEIIAGSGSRTQALPLDTVDIVPQHIVESLSDRGVQGGHDITLHDGAVGQASSHLVLWLTLN